MEERIHTREEIEIKCNNLIIKLQDQSCDICSNRMRKERKGSYNLKCTWKGYCSKKHITLLLKKLKEMNIYDKYLSSLSIMGGEGIIVEIDETKVGKNKNHRVKLVKGFWCFGMVERTIERKIIILYIKKRNKETLTNLLVKYVSTKSTI
ncbi:DDE-TNP-IS1595 domain-containing protein [Vairimorpha necatrix]|uniref:DDE-TNP-IS1595 domain-containing protein n=1 Tax=Vairimorpha necatrix TaxID=6039 RepID=A0AAX4JBI1_9MICR